MPEYGNIRIYTEEEKQHLLRHIHPLNRFTEPTPEAPEGSSPLPVIDKSFLEMEPDVDVTSFCRSIMADTRATHDLVISKFDYCAGGCHLARNGWKMLEKIYVRRLKARAWLNRMWEKPKTREHLQQTITELWEENEAIFKRARLKQRQEIER